MSSDNSELAGLIEREDDLVLARFTMDDAWTLGCLLREEARRRDAPVAIEISTGPTIVFSVLLPGATDDNLGWTRRKAALAWRFRRSSYVSALKLKAGDNLFERFGLDHRTYAAAGGAVPIKVAGVGMIGVAAVSGLPQSEDHELVLAALSQLRAQSQGDER